jgi:hypothetical protein
MDKLVVRFGGNEQMARAVWKMNESYRKIKEERESKRIKIIDFKDLPKKPAAGTRQSTAQAVTCQAITLSGRPCKFKATCGKFCKKHKV